ncbi:hypothetical protein L596_005230 [Steinernema carpocapsae]|uniref:Uncharacterized protein n=1 Tax=Steinernema carpocapsae TaxID=34508 RepID=A0A4U8UZE9_STECR|nr:hypothetical protein L596_005230 [Steinernema carpocapsae]
MARIISSEEVIGPGADATFVLTCCVTVQSPMGEGAPVPESAPELGLLPRRRADVLASRKCIKVSARRKNDC